MKHDSKWADRPIACRFGIHDMAYDPYTPKSSIYDWLYCLRCKGERRREPSI